MNIIQPISLIIHKLGHKEMYTEMRTMHVVCIFDSSPNQITLGDNFATDWKFLWSV